MQRTTTLTRMALAAVLALGGAGLGLSQASAAPAPESAQEQSLSAGLLPALQRDLGLDADEARTRLASEARAAKTEPAAREAAGAAFGGAWYDARRGTLVVGLTEAAGARTAEAVRAAGAAVRQVPHTAAELDAAKAAIDARAGKEGAPDGVSSWHVDPRSSSVVVEVREDAAEYRHVASFVRQARAAGPVRVEQSDAGAPQTYAAGVVGGDPYYINGNTRCSIGFAVHGGFVTAGHCGGAGSSVAGWDGSAMGSVAGSSFPGNDYGHVRIGNGWWTVPVVLGWGTVSDVLVRGSREAPVGSSICRSGSTTHWHCGTLLAKNETVNYSQGSVYGLTKTSVCAEPGDSGGSFITGDQAQGVTSGGWGNCSGGGQTWYQPVNEILSVYGLTLVTA